MPRALQLTPGGHVYRARFKPFPVQTDEDFLTVAAYVERNALRLTLFTDKVRQRREGRRHRRTLNAVTGGAGQ